MIRCKWSTNSIKILCKISRKKNKIIHKLNNNNSRFRDLFSALQWGRYNNKLLIKDNRNNPNKCFRSSYLICITHLFSILTCHNKSQTKSKVRILNVCINLLINESQDQQINSCKKAQLKKDIHNSLSKVKVSQYNNHEEWWFKTLFNNNNQKDKEDLLIKKTKIHYVKDLWALKFNKELHIIFKC